MMSAESAAILVIVAWLLGFGVCWLQFGRFRGACNHPAQRLRFDGLNPDVGLGLEFAGCATCTSCKTTLCIEVREDFAARHGRDGGGRASSIMDDTIVSHPVPLTVDSARNRQSFGVHSVQR